MAIGKWLVFAEKWKKVVPKVGNKNDLEVGGGGALQTIRPTSSLSLSQTQFLSLSLSHRFVSLSFSFFLSLSLSLCVFLSLSHYSSVCLSVFLPLDPFFLRVSTSFSLSLFLSHSMLFFPLYFFVTLLLARYTSSPTLSLFHPKLFFSQSQVLSLSLTYSV